ncbi:restriction endonuclease subunit S [uncultured Bifidobacterium sp.]|uniref:restriction endonuclease subunit S n=1 Tax=uncultured Bifidobacterium sp. TaxID=165187 RepID=UPI0027DBAACF|nr:restriction endonuclease subunit S [uncultured Bifidobacterium sp.]
MSRIDDLIAEYCPNGVERKPLGAIAKLYRGNGLQKKDFTDKGIGCIHYGQIYTRYDTFTSQTISFVDKKLADKLLKVHPNDLIVTATSENLEDVCKAVAWLGGSDIVTGGHSIVVRHHQNAKYLSYYFQTLDFFQRKRAYVHGTKVMEIKKDDLAKIVVPVPPLPVQEEIARILDSFSSLEAELEAELEARRKQYAYYRNELLTFDGERVQWLKLGEAAFINKGTYITKKQVIPGNIPVILGGVEPAYWHSESNHDGEGIVISRSGANAGFASYWNEPIFVSDGFVLDAKPGIDMRFLFHVLKKQQAKLHSMKRGSGVPHINSKMLANNVAIPVPPLEEQRHVVSILDRFDKLTNDLSSGLPAEIEARRKQYEYYRDRLLSFAELAV